MAMMHMDGMALGMDCGRRRMLRYSWRLISAYCLFGVKKYIFSIFYALFGMLLKGMGKRFLLSKDTPLTPDIGGVMAL